jgi:hypothetical protein
MMSLFFHWKLSKSVLFVENGPPNELEIRTEKKWFLVFVPLPVMSIIFLERVSSRWCVRRPLILQQNGEDSIDICYFGHRKRFFLTIIRHFLVR